MNIKQINMFISTLHKSRYDINAFLYKIIELSEAIQYLKVIIFKV